MEIVLAIGLTSVVMYLLMTAIELYMVRVDSSRSRVESAQLARTILDQMAADIVATRLYSPQSSTVGGGNAPAQGATAGEPAASGPGASNSQPAVNGASRNSSGGPSGSAPSNGVPSTGAPSGSAAPLAPAQVQGIFGEINQLRIDRSATPNWQRAARQVLPEEPATAADMPMSVRYFLNDGDRQTSQEFALEGVGEEPTTDSRAGLYREVFTTATATGETDPLAATADREGARLELLAPEVVKMELAYFDGTDLVETWDSFDEGALPVGVEIRLTIHEPSFADPLETPSEVSTTGQPRYKPNELVEYRRFVRFPSVTPAQPAEALLPMPGGGGNGDQFGGGGPGGGGGANGPGQGGNNGQGGAGRNSGSTGGGGGEND
jgi:hypothetical protein